MSHHMRAVILNPIGFLADVVSAFRANQGILLSGAVAYYSMLSVLPMAALVLLLLSQFVDQDTLLATLYTYLDLITVDQSEAIMEQIRRYLANWHFHGVVGLAVMLFFSSMAFTALENAICVIFHHRVAIQRRRFLVSAILPYFYMVLLTVGLMTVSIVSAALGSSETRVIPFLWFDISLAETSATIVYVFGILGEVLLLSSIYLVMPVGKIAFRHALIGGVAATVLWEATRHVMVWWFSTVSVVNVIYGSFATMILILVGFEVAALIVLFGAQVIAVYERICMPRERDSGFQT
ncbi:MAG: YihY/virulence factor BrkB family protein [Gammaproteobacteria bacterium]|jgi:YihY family inner membrane protein|nr:YihY/virulence factor BrkB family protein [Gammaproteobacteria bacterium]